MMRRSPVGTIRSSATLAVGSACLSLLLGSSSASGQACPCTRRDLATVVKQSDVIFAGRPLAATTDAGRVGAQPAVAYQARFAFDVATVLKGTTTRATTVVTPVGPCGAGFVVGTEYLVLGKKDGGGVVTDACQGNVSGAEAIGARAAAIRAVLAPPASPPAATAAP